MNKQLKSIEKIMELKEKHFNESQAQYQRAVEHFETAGQQLYKILKAKENLENEQRKKIKTRFKAFELKSHYQQLEHLKYQESEWQAKVHQARLNLKDKEDRRTEAHFEFKKLEKVRDNRLKSFKKKRQAEENQQLDEVSVQQYMRVNG